MSTVECIACGHVGAPKTKGSFIITIILLCFGFIPGLIYEVWRRSGGKVCSACGSGNVRLYVPRPVQAQQQPRVDALQNKTQLVATDMFAHNAGNKAQLNDDGVEQKNCPDCRELIRFDARKCKHCGSMVSE